jgi:hypothetical protein
VGADGSDPFPRVGEACFWWLTIGEIVVRGYDGKPEQAIDARMKSPGHRYNLLFDHFTELGSGYAYKSRTTYKHSSTVNFGPLKGSSYQTSRVNYACSDYLEEEAGENLLVFSASCLAIRCWIHLSV